MDVCVHLIPNFINPIELTFDDRFRVSVLRP